MHVTIAASLSDGSVAIMLFYLVGRGDVLPRGAAWISESPDGHLPPVRTGFWKRPNSDQLVADELERTFNPPSMMPPEARRTVLAWRRIDANDVPQDRAFRGAWELSVDGVMVNLTKARSLHRDRLRAIRRPLLLALDAEYLRADERGDITAKAAVAQRKQALRDITADPAIDAASTPAELKAAIPEALRAEGAVL